MIYFENDIKVIICPYRKPRKSERTFPAVKGSVSNIGHKAEILTKFGFLKHKHG